MRHGLKLRKATSGRKPRLRTVKRAPNRRKQSIVMEQVERIAPINSHSPAVSVIIPVMNERKTIARVIQQAGKIHRDTEIIVVANGSTDGTAAAAARSGAKVIRFVERLGHDVGRAIGAREARGRILLFMDGDIIISGVKLRKLVQAVEAGVDVALNQYSGATRAMSVHSVVLAKHALNCALGRADLKGASMTAIPHAISRSALQTIGWECLAVPPKAQALAVTAGLNVQAVHYYDVGSKNPQRRRTASGVDPLKRVIVGDHLEAFHAMLQLQGDRGNLTDLYRNREMVR